MTVAELKQKGATQLDDAALKALLVGKYTWLRNTVTGGQFKVQWSDTGRQMIMNVDPRIAQPSAVGDIARGSYLGISGSDYVIKDGKIVVSLGNRDYETAVYKMGDKYYGARSNEFGYANYEIVPVPNFLGTEIMGEMPK